MNINQDIETLINKMSRLPGLGPRSARRAVLHLLKNKDKAFSQLITAMQTVHASTRECPVCGNIDVFTEKCSICSDTARNNQLICIVESVSDVWAIERSNCFNGTYHILHGLLSSLDGNGPDGLLLDRLIKRCEENNVSEIVIALSATLDGQTTDQYIRGYISDVQSCSNIKISSLAVGIPIGGELDFIDDGTLFTAFNFRK